MSVSFNLTDQKWIPCVFLDGTSGELGLLDTLAQAHEIREIHDASPLVTVSLHRLLLAILHRNFGPESPTKWRELWNAGSFDAEILEDYLGKHYAGFDLFDKDHPFYQVKSIPDGWLKPVSILVHDISASSSSPLFSHASNQPIPARIAARALVAQQTYSLGGTLSREIGAKPGAQGGRLVPGVMLILTGKTLFETLMLNMVCYNPANNEPADFYQAYNGTEPDIPVWENYMPTRYAARPCRGYIDYLTWQMRRIKLGNFVSNGKDTLVCTAALAGGWEFNTDFAAKDPAMAYRLNKTPKNNDPEQNQPWMAWKPDRTRLLWRDCDALLRNFDPQPGEKSERPKVIDWISRLQPKKRDYLIDVHGVWYEPGHQVNIYFWRHERLPLPASYLESESIVATLQSCLHIVEQRVAKPLRNALWTMAREIEAPDKTDNKVREDKSLKKIKEKVDKRAGSYPTEGIYWSRMEIPFKSLLLRLPDAVVENCSEVEVNKWASLAARTALDSLDETIRGMGMSPKNMRAGVKARGHLLVCIGKWFSEKEVDDNE